MRDRHTQRIIKQLIICFVSGVIATIAVAWGCAAFGRYPKYKYAETFLEFAEHDDAWFVCKQRRFFGERLAATAYPEIMFASEESGFVSNEVKLPDSVESIPSWVRVELSAAPNSAFARRLGTYIDDACGWPLVCLSSQTCCTWENDRSVPVTTVRDGISLQPNTNRTPLHAHHSATWTWRVLPLRPIWLNFVYCILFYAAIAWFLFFGPGALRRWLRKRRNRCPRCGYDLRDNESSHCPECGDQRRADAPEFC